MEVLGQGQKNPVDNLWSVEGQVKMRVEQEVGPSPPPLLSVKKKFGSGPGRCGTVNCVPA